LSLGGEDRRALLALGFHLLLHRGDNLSRWRDVLNLVSKHLYTPRLSRFVDLGHHVLVDMRPGFKGLIELDLADLASEGGLRELDNAEEKIIDAVRSRLRVDNTNVHNTVNSDLNVITRDTDLLRDIDNLLLERVSVSNGI
jgi:hypothetical protein